MENNTITDLIQAAMTQLKDELDLTEGTLKNYRCRSFRPIEEFFKLQKVIGYDQKLIDELQSLYETQLEVGYISRSTFTWRARGIGIISEIQERGHFEWRVFSHKKKELLNEYFEKILNVFSETLTCSAKRKSNYESIIRRFFNFLMLRGYDDFAEFNPMIIRDFLSKISVDRPNSMDDVIYGMRKLFLHLNENGNSVDFNILLLACPKRHRRKVYPCMNIHEISELLNHIDQTTSRGKRDYALLLLAATTGLRAGDLANLKLRDIDWKQCEISIVQGKTKEQLILPLNSIVRDALADYILNGRPVSDSPNIFLRSIAPYNEFFDGVSVACVLRKYLKSLGIERKIDDGKTFHGIRRMLATNMTASKVPVTTISQVLGHKNMDVTKRYIALDVQGLKNCTLGLSSLTGGKAE
jgi:integrase